MTDQPTPVQTVQFQPVPFSPETVPFEPETVSAVIFDIGGVFLYPHYRSVVAALGEQDEPTTARLRDFRHAHHAGCLALADLDAEARETHGASFWDTYDSAYAAALGLQTAQIKTAIRTSWDWAHEANIQSFHRLAGTGMPVAIVSNNSGTAPEQMRDHGVCQVLPGGPLPQVSAIIDSSLVGVSKPDPVIMAPALYALGVQPQNALYVGDTVHADVVGARNAGMQVVQLDPFGHHEAFDHMRFPDLASLVDALEVD